MSDPGAPRLPRVRGPWDARRVAAFLTEERSPLRLALKDGRGHPLVVSLWYRWDGTALWCATHASSKVAGWLQDDARVGFEVSVNDPPYCGVRGQGRVTLLPERGGDELGALLDRYLGGRDSSLARWLLSRAEGEVALRLEPRWLVSWDFGERMRDAVPPDRTGG